MTQRMLFCLFATGCALDGAPPDEPVADPDRAVVCEVPPGFDTLPDGAILVEGDLRVSTVAELEADCAAGRPWHGWDRIPGARKVTPYAVGRTASSWRWPNGRIPYELDPALPPRTLVTIGAAIQEWETNTSIDLVLRQSSDTDYVYFTNGASCYSDTNGRVGGRQDIALEPDSRTDEIVGTAISSGADVYTWFSDGIVMAGTTSDLSATRSAYGYTMPPGYFPSQIVAMAILKSNNRVYAWYDDGYFSAGTSSNLDAYLPLQTYTLPPGESISQIVDIDFDETTGDTYTWFSDGKMSVGVTYDLDFRQPLKTFKVATGESWGNVRGVAVSTIGRIYAWYADGTASSGTTTDLDSDKNGFTYKVPGGCGNSGAIHEVGHAVGLAHEQKRSDRDDHVRVFLDNVPTDKQHDFDKVDSSYSNFGDYDLTSRMHYRMYADSIDGSPTILGLVLPGQDVPKADVVDMAIDSASNVYTWWSNNTVTVGHSDDLEATKARLPYTHPAGKTIVGIGFRTDSDVYTYYDDGTYSIGHPDNLTAVDASQSYKAAIGHGPKSILSIDIAPSGHVYAWYRDGTVSSGTTSDLGFYTAPETYSVAAGKLKSDVLGIAIAPTSWCYAWYASGSASAGTSTDLDANRALYNFTSRLATYTPLDVLSPGDKAAVAAMYPD